MKWRKPPLGLFAIPPLIGLAAAFVGTAHLTLIAPLIGLEDGTFFGDISPLMASWFCLLLFTAATIPSVPKSWGDPEEMRLGIWSGTALAFLPQLCGVALIFCLAWFLVIITGWLFISSYQWKYDVPPFRTGLWLGVGGLSGMFMGALLLGLFITF